MTIWKGSKLGSPATIGDDTQKWATHHSVLGSGGHQEVPTIADRDAIPVDVFLHEDGNGSGRRRNMMLCSVGDDGTGSPQIYQLFISGFNDLSDGDKLTALEDNTNWSVLSEPIIYVNTTYAALTILKAGNLLVPGTWYKFTYNTKYRQLVTGTINTASAETLVILATSVNTFDPIVKSVTFPQDIIEYDFDNVLCEDGTTARNGFITRRIDVIRNTGAGYDFRKILFRRYKPLAASITAWASTTFYNANDLIKNGTVVYRARIDHTSTTVFSDDVDDGNWLLVLPDITDYISPVMTTCNFMGASIPVDNATFSDFTTFNESGTVSCENCFVEGIKTTGIELFAQNVVFNTGSSSENINIYIGGQASRITFTTSDCDNISISGYTSSDGLIIMNSGQINADSDSSVDGCLIKDCRGIKLIGDNQYLSFDSCSNLTITNSFVTYFTNVNSSRFHWIQGVSFFRNILLVDCIYNSSLNFGNVNNGEIRNCNGIKINNANSQNLITIKNTINKTFTGTLVEFTFDVDSLGQSLLTTFTGSYTGIKVLQISPDFNVWYKVMDDSGNDLPAITLT